MPRTYGGGIAGAIALAAEIHQNQYDKGGRPYILHPIRVMERLKHKEGDWQIVAMLHDVLEDNPQDVYDNFQLGALIEAEFGLPVLDYVICLTRVDHEDYFDYISRVKNQPITRAVKLADLEDNMDILRQPTLDDKALGRLMKYHTAYRILRER